jgi:hypothetical protein
MDGVKPVSASNQIRYINLAAPERFKVILYILAAFDSQAETKAAEIYTFPGDTSLVLYQF